MAASSRDLIVNLVGKTNKLMSPLQGASAQLSGLGSKLTKTLTPAAAALGATFAGAARDFNAGKNAIITATGAAGDELGEFESIMKRLGGRVPQDLGQIGVAIGEVNTRLGLTGPELESVSKKMLDLARVSGADVGTTVANTTRLFGDWAVATEDQSRALDVVFEATKRTGIGLDRLTTLTVQYGAPLRQLGFGFEEATALMSKFEKEGVNTETVVGGLRQALGRMARAGEDPIETFNRVIVAIKEAGSAGEANALALDLFGQRAGPDMAAAVREGKFELEELVEQLNGSEGALDDVAARTVTMADKFKMLRNRISGFLGPYGEIGAVGAGVLASLGPVLLGLGQMGPLLTKAATGWGKATTAMSAHKGALVGITAAIGVAIFAYRELTEDQRRVEAASRDMTEAIRAAGDVLEGTADSVRARVEDSDRFAAVMARAGLTVGELSTALRSGDDQWQQFTKSAEENTLAAGANRIEWVELQRDLGTLRAATRKTDEHLADEQLAIEGVSGALRGMSEFTGVAAKELEEAARPGGGMAQFTAGAERAARETEDLTTALSDLVREVLGTDAPLNDLDVLLEDAADATARLVDEDGNLAESNARTFDSAGRLLERFAGLATEADESGASFQEVETRSSELRDEFDRQREAGALTTAQYELLNEALDRLTAERRISVTGGFAGGPNAELFGPGGRIPVGDSGGRFVPAGGASHGLAVLKRGEIATPPGAPLPGGATRVLAPWTLVLPDLRVLAEGVQEFDIDSGGALAAGT